MRTTATHNGHYNATAPVLCLAFELSEKSWKLGCPTGHGQKPRERMLPARNAKRLLDEITHAKARCGLPETARVVSCYKAGREGFWLHRFLQMQRISNSVGDSSSIAVNRRQRRGVADGTVGSRRANGAAAGGGPGLVARQPGRAWLTTHDRRVKRAGGWRVVVCPLPRKS